MHQLGPRTQHGEWGPLGTRETGQGLQGPQVPLPCSLPLLFHAWSAALTLESPGTGRAWGHSVRSSPGACEATSSCAQGPGRKVQRLDCAFHGRGAQARSLPRN